MRFFFAALVLAIWASPAATEDCHPVETVVAAIHHNAPVAKYVTLDPAQTKAVADWYNRLPPEADDTYDLVLILLHDDGRIGIVLGNAGMACRAHIVPPPLVEGLMKAIAGEGA